jgi:beta-phosphoglucomutase family hydrolase
MERFFLKQETMKSFKAVIFDMDGTLINSIPADFLAWQQLFSNYEKSLSLEEYIPLLGIKSAEVAEKFLPLKDENELKHALANKLVYFENIIEEHGIEAIPYARDFILQLKQYDLKLALATSSRKAKMKLVMERVGLFGFFDVVITAEDVKKGKPEPDIFLTTAQKLSVLPNECVVFEDAINGVAAAKNANMKCVALSSERTQGMLSQADVIINSFKNLDYMELCKRLKKSN